MNRWRATINEHRHCLVVTTVLTLVLTFPTIVYIFRTDVFWHPAGAAIDVDVYIKFWDVWYGKQFLTGQADHLYTNLMFYPRGLSLSYHPFFLPHITLISALGLVLPVSNAFSLAHLLIIWSSALSAYVYLRWLFKDKWISLFGAVVFGFSPHVTGHPNHPNLAFMTIVVLTLYCFHRGIIEDRRFLVLVAGLLAGLTIAIDFYMYICVLMLLGLYLCAFASSRWRDKRYWFLILLLGLSIAVSSWWRVYPMVAGSDSISEVVNWHGERETRSDVLSFLVNCRNPLYGRAFETIINTSHEQISTTSFLGYLPLLLVCAGLVTTATRRRALPWLFSSGLFLILRLGSHLTINGVTHLDIRLPKYYLDQILPSVFQAFTEVDHFMMGALLPFAVSACLGLVALQSRFPTAAKPQFVLALLAIVALEYFIPVQADRIFPVGDGKISQERLAFLEWLEQEDNDDIRLINLPMGRRNSKIYNLYQSLSGYPQVEGAISRTPESAFDYIRANFLLNAWHNKQPINCEVADRNDYLAGLAQLEADGFSHIVYHHEFKDWKNIRESFRDIIPSYSDDLVSIYRPQDLRDGCSEVVGARFAFTTRYAAVLQSPSILDERHGTIVIFPQTVGAADHFLRHLPLGAHTDRIALITRTYEPPGIDIRSFDVPDSDWTIDLESTAAVWLINDQLTFNAEQTYAYQEWFTKRFRFCRRHHEDRDMTIDLYLKPDLPCSAVDESSAFEVNYEDGVRLHHLSYAVQSDAIRFYLAWSKASTDPYAFSLQFFDAEDNKLLQHDDIVYRQALSAYDIDILPLPAGAYSVRLIVYDYETHASSAGMAIDSGQRFERQLEVARIEVER